MKLHWSILCTGRNILGKECLHHQNKNQKGTFVGIGFLGDKITLHMKGNDQDSGTDHKDLGRECIDLLQDRLKGGN